jgi:hypothetical protein
MTTPTTYDLDLDINSTLQETLSSLWIHLIFNDPVHDFLVVSNDIAIQSRDGIELMHAYLSSSNDDTPATLQIYSGLQQIHT